MRYSEEDKDDLLLNSTLLPDTELLGAVLAAADPGRDAAARRATRRASGPRWTPKFGIDWRPADDQLYYASYSKGFKSGGFNDLSVINPPFDPEYVKSYEIGAKTEWLDNTPAR